jgi:hypothetical protein
VTSSWLRLREPADAAARSVSLAAAAQRVLGDPAGVRIHDLGCGTGSMARWLAPLLSGPQHWIMYDRDPELLEYAAISVPDKARDGTAVTVETRQRDVTRLTARDFASADLVTASALLDMLTADEIEAIVAACAGARCPALLTLSVVGRVRLTPADPLDARIAAAFNDHQRRTVGGRRLLGPDAVGCAVSAYERFGMTPAVDMTAWQLGADCPDLLSEWFVGWVAAACEQDPQLTGPAGGYADRRRDQIAAGELSAVIEHQDLFALCG